MASTKTENFGGYLKSKLAGKGTAFTHTRIPDRDAKIYGGTYIVGDDEAGTFLEKYYQHVMSCKILNFDFQPKTSLPKA